MTHNANLVSENSVSPSPRLLSIVIAAYNHESFVSECLNSILNCRRLDDVEIIVIDDGSPDNTLEVIEQTLAAANVNFCIFTKSNKGLTDSLDLGLNLATGKYVSFIASDDAYYPNGLASCLEKLADLDDTNQAILFQGEYFGTLSGPVYAQPTLDLFALGGKEFVKAISLEYPKPMLLQSTIFGTSFLKSISPWSDKLGLDDWPTFIKVAQQVASGMGHFRYDPSIVLCRYRVHSAGIHTNLDRQLAVCLEVADTVVDVSFRSQCRSNILLDIALIHLYHRNFVKFLPLFFKGMWEYPSWPTYSRVPTRVVKSAIRRLRARLFSDVSFWR